MKTEEEIKGLKTFLESQRRQVQYHDSRKGYSVNIDCIVTLIDWIIDEEKE